MDSIDLNENFKFGLNWGARLDQELDLLIKNKEVFKVIKKFYDDYSKKAYEELMSAKPNPDSNDISEKLAQIKNVTANRILYTLANLPEFAKKEQEKRWKVNRKKPKI